MYYSICNKICKKVAIALALVMAASLLLAPGAHINAADHAEATLVAAFPGGDIADVFAFLDPNDNSKVILAMDVEGFIVPSEIVNLGFFSPDVKFEFQIENTGDAVADKFIDVTFSPQTSRMVAQTATVSFSSGQTFTAPTTVPNQNPTAPPFVVTTDPGTGVSFFAGMTDDPFFFDIVGFNRFIASVQGGSPDPTKLERGRDSFAGYSIHMIALSIPATLLKGSAGNVIGINGVTFTRKKTIRGKDDVNTDAGKFAQFDRMATPAVNTVLIPYPRKNEYNASTPADDAAGKFANDIVMTLMGLGTNSTNIYTLASVAVKNGDYLRLDTSVPNRSLGTGEKFGSTGFAGFPNGRRPGDDVVDTLILLVTNEGITTGDHVDANDVPFGSTFPFFAPPHQPLDSGVDDNTRN
ncbi:MAG TPA: DUF4331 family protein [Blastocatellia bacterium]|nr:DUF4331 family protein [Blastocatellia bacterium]